MYLTYQILQMLQILQIQSLNLHHSFVWPPAYEVYTNRAFVCHFFFAFVSYFFYLWYVWEYFFEEQLWTVFTWNYRCLFHVLLLDYLLSSDVDWFFTCRFLAGRFWIYYKSIKRISCCMASSICEKYFLEKILGNFILTFFIKGYIFSYLEF